MKQNHYDIQDTEIRIIGESSAKPKKRYGWLILGILLVVGIILTIISLCTRTAVQEEVGLFEQSAHQTIPHPLRNWIHSLDSISESCVVTKDTIVNDIPMRLYVPLNTTPRLEVGYKCIDDTTHNLLLFQAADIRADNQKIVGAFVLRGKPLSWGLSKKGYCGIIGDEVTVGVADNSPLFEQATEAGGYFFRQYPLVSNGILVENELKSQSTRRGLCELEGKIVVVETFTPESLHDFSQALVDIGTTNAIYLVGSSAIGWHRTIDGRGIASGQWEPRVYKNVSFIVWSK
jgi:hypothetical protein